MLKPSLTQEQFRKLFRALEAFHNEVQIDLVNFSTILSSTYHRENHSDINGIFKKIPVREDHTQAEKLAAELEKEKAI